MANGNNDNRIVEMQFKNREFEQNIAKSQKSLERFKKELDFKEASKGLEEFAQTAKDSIQFDTLANNIQKLTDKFTGLGHVGEYVISRIRRSLESMGDKVISFTNSMTTVQQSAGFAKYESLNKAVQTLKSATGKEEKEIYGVLKRLTDYTDETSYDMAEGVTSISKLVSSGAAGLKQAEQTIEGFYNMAAKAGADTRTASHALQYSLTQAMSTGFMGYRDWQTLENSSLATIDFKNALLEEAVALKKATKEGDKYYIKTKKGKKVEVNATNLWKESLKEQWVTVDVLNGALGKYADTSTDFGKEAFAAAQRCTTFTDALNAWKDMLASGWMQTYRTLFGDLGDAMNLFSSFCNKVSDALGGLADARNRLLKVWKTSGGRDTLWGMLMGEMETPEGEIMFKGQRGILDMITGAGEMIQGAFWDMVKETMSEEDKASLELWAGNTEAIMDMLKQNGMLDGLTEEELEELQEFVSQNFNERGFLQMYLGEKLAEATKNVQNFIEKVHEWFNVVDESTGTTRFQKLQTVLQAVMNTVRFIAEIIGGVIDFIGELLGPDHLGPAIDAIIDLFSELGLAINDAENDVSKSGGIKAFFHALAEVLKPVTKFISKTIILIIELIRAIVSWGKESGAFTKAFETVKTVLKSIFDTLKTVTAPVGKLLTEIGEIVKDLFKNGFSAESLANAGARIREAFINMFAGLKQAAAPVLEKIGTFFATVWQSIKDFFTRTFTSENMTFAWDAVKAFFSGIFAKLGVLLGPIGEKVGGFFSGLWRTISNAISGFISGNPLFAKLLDWLKDSFQKILDFFSNIGNLFKGEGNFTQKIKGAFEGIFGSFKDFNLSSILKTLIGPMGIAGAGTLIYSIIKMIRGDGKRTGLSAIFSAVTDSDKNAKTSAVSSFVSKFLTFSAGMLMISVSIKVLEQTKLFERLGKLCTSLFDALKNIGNIKLTKPMQGIIAIGAVVLALAVLIKKIGRMNKSMEAGRQGGAGGVESFASKLLQFAAAMGLLALAVKVLESTGTFQALGNMFKKAQETFKNVNLTTILQQIAGPLKVIGTYLLAFELIRTAKQIAKAFKSLSETLRNGIAIKGLGQAERTGDKILKIAASIAILTGCIYLIGNMETGKAIQGVVGLIALMTILGVFAGVMTRVMKQADWKNLVGMASSCISIGIGIGAILLALKPIMSLEGPEAWEKVKRSLLALVVVLAAVGLFMWATRDLGKTYAKDTKRVNQFKGFLTMAAGVYVLIKALIKLTELEWNAEKGLSQIQKLGIVAGGLAVFFLACAGAVRLAGKGAIKDLGLFAAGLAILLFSLKSIASMDTGPLLTMFASLGIILFEFAGFALLLRKWKGNMKDTGLKEAAWLALGIAILIRALLPIANLYDKEGQSHWEKLAMMGATLGGVLLALGLFAKLMNKTTFKASGFASIIMLAAGIFAVLLALKPIAKLSNMEDGWEKLGMMGAALGGVIISLMGLSWAMSKTSFKKKGFANILILAAGILAIVLALLPIANIAKEANGLAQLGAMGGAFVLILGGFTGVAILMQKHAGSWKKAKAGIASLIALVAALSITLDLLRPMAFMNTEQLVKMGAVFGAFILGMVAVIGILSTLGGKAQKGTIIASMVGIILSIITMALALNAVNNISIGHAITFILGIGTIFAAILGTIKKFGPSTKAQLRNFEWAIGSIIAVIAVAAGGLIGLKLVNVDLGTIISFMAGISAVAAAIAFSLGKSGVITDNEDELKSMIAAIAGIAGIMAVAAGSLMGLKAVGVDLETMIPFLAGISAVSAAIAFSLGKSGVITDNEDELKSIIAALAGIAGIMLVAAGSLIALKAANVDLATMIAFFAGVSVAVAAIAFSLGKSGVITDNEDELKSMVAALAGIAAIMVVAALALTMIPKDLDLGKMITFFAGVALVSAAIALSLGKSGVLSDNKDQLWSLLITLVGIAGVMVAAGFALSLIPTDMDWTQIAAFMVGLALVSGVLIASLGKFSTSGTQKMKSMIIELVGLAVVLVAAGFALSLIKDVSWDQILAFSVGLSLMMVSMFGAIKMQRSTSIKKVGLAIAAMVAMCAPMYVLSIALNKVRDVDWSTILGFAAGLSIMMVAMAGAIKILQGVDIGAGLKAIILIAAGMVVLLEAMALIAEHVAGNVGNAFVTIASSMDLAISMLADFMENMNRFTEADTESAKRKIGMLKDIFSQMNGFSSYTKDVEDFTTVLFELGVMLPYFHEMTKDIPDPETSTAIKTINKLIEIAPSLQSLTFGDGPVEIAMLGAGLAVFNELASGISDDFSESPAIKLLDLLLGKTDQMAALTQAGDIGTQLARIGAGVHHFVTGTNELGEGLSAIPDDAMEMPGIKLIQALAENAEGIKTIATMSELDQLADRLTLLGGAMSIYALGANEYAQTGDNGIENFDVDQATTLLNQVAQSLGGENEFKVPKLPGEGDLNTFAAQMAALGSGMLKFVESCNGISGKFWDGMAALGMLVDIKSKLNYQTLSVFGLLKDKTDDELAGLGTDLSVIATGLKDFIGASEGITGNTQKGLDAIGFLAEIRGKLVEDGYKAINAITTFGTYGISTATLASFGLELWTLATGLQAFISASNGINANTTEGLGAIQYLANLKDQLVKIDLEELTAKIEALGEMEDGTFDITNESSALGRFSAGIIDLGAALSQFVQDVNFPDEYKEPFENAKQSLEYFRGLQARMPRDKGGLVEFFAGHAKDMGAMSTSINSLGTAMGSFANSLNMNNYDIAKVDSAVYGVDKLISAGIRYSQVADVYDSSSTPVNLHKVHNFFTALNSEGKNLAQVIGEFYTQMSESMAGLSVEQIQALSGSIDVVTHMVETIVALYGKYWSTLADTKKLTGVDIGYLGASDFITMLFNDFQTLVEDPEIQSNITNALSILNTLQSMLQMVIDLQNGVLSLDPGITSDSADRFAQILVGFMDSFISAVKLSGNDLDLDKASTIATTIHDLSDAVFEIASMTETDFAGPFGEGLKPLGTLLSEGIRDGLSSTSAKELMIEGLKGALDWVIEQAPKDTEMLTKATHLGGAIVGMMNAGMVGTAVGAHNGAEKLSFADQLVDGMGFYEIGGLLHNQMEKFEKGEATASLFDVAYAMAYDIGTTISKPECVGLIAKGLEFAFVDAISTSNTIGFNISNGVAIGLLSGETLVTDAATAVANAAINAFKTETDQESPSKVFAVLGGYLSEGLAIGMTEKEGEVIASAEGMANDAITTVTTLMATLSSLMSQDIDSNPTITPVIDLSNVNSGASFINSLFGGRGFSLGVGVGANYAQQSVPRTGRSTGEYQGTDLTGVMNRIDSLGNRITEMGNKISDIQIVLDTGALVGGVTGGVNANIGKKTVYGRRRNA